MNLELELWRAILLPNPQPAINCAGGEQLAVLRPVHASDVLLPIRAVRWVAWWFPQDQRGTKICWIFRCRDIPQPYGRVF